MGQKATDAEKSSRGGSGTIMPLLFGLSGWLLAFYQHKQQTAREDQIRGEMQHREDQLRGQMQAREDQIRDWLLRERESRFSQTQAPQRPDGAAPSPSPAPFPAAGEGPSC